MLMGFLSDAHGNLEAFVAGLEVLAAAGASEIHFLGDAVGYLPGDAVVTELRRRNISSILGNHDAAVMGGPRPAGLERVLRLSETAASLSPANRAFLSGLPQRLESERPCGTVLMVHGSPADPMAGYVYVDSPLPVVGPQIRAVFMGQTHRPFIRTAKSVTYVNVGSCGLPRDCGRLGSVGVFDDERRRGRIIRYDIRAATARALLRLGPVADEVMSVFSRDESGSCVES
jgi:predicted phosphodiesterase